MFISILVAVGGMWIQFKSLKKYHPHAELLIQLIKWMNDENKQE